jgi:hypothetical protein
MYVTYDKCYPPQIKMVSSYENMENPCSSRVLSNISESILLFEQLILWTLLILFPHFSVPPTTKIELLILATLCPFLCGKPSDAYLVPLYLFEKFISILNNTIHMINNDFYK